MVQTAARPRRERKENADKRRRQLLNAARRSIVENGLAKTTLATVAEQAGLSQGVAIFYYKSKNGLLSAVLEDLYQSYEDSWQSALAAAKDSPASQLVALINADFDESVCNSETLSIWFAFWGEQKFTPQYAAITGQFDRNRSEAIRALCARLVTPANTATQVADWIDSLSDGYWQRLHLFPDDLTREAAQKATLALAQTVIPDLRKS